MAQYDGSIRINTKIDTKGLNKGESAIKSSFDRIGSAAKKLATTIAAAFAVGKIIEFGKAAIQAAADFEAMDAQFAQVFGDMESVASKSLSQIAKQAGITEERMKSSYTKIAAFAKTTGMDAAGSIDLANRAMTAVADSAAFYDRSLEDVTESLQSFLKGNYENDAALGLSATEFTRNAAANKLYGKSFIELSEAQKQLTLLQMVEDANRLSGALGQAAREADTWTNQTGNLNQALTNLKANLGKFILPVAIQAVKMVTNVINAINAMISRLYAAASAFRSFSSLLTGNRASAGAGVQSTGMGAAAEEYNGAASAADSLAESTEKVASATNDAKKAAEKYLSPLDEINKLGKEEASSGAGAAGGIDASGGIDFGSLAEGDTVIDKVEKTTSKLLEKLKELRDIFAQGFWDGLGDWEYRWESIKASVASIKDSLVDIWKDPAVLSAGDNWAKSIAQLLGSIAGSMASIGMTIATNLIGGIAEYLGQNKDRIKSYLVSMFDIRAEINRKFSELFDSIAYVFEAFASEQGQQLTANIIGIFADSFMGATELAGRLAEDIFGAIIQPFVDNKEEFRTALEGFLSVLSEITGTIKEGIDETFDKLNEVYDEHFKPFFDSIANGLSDTVGKFMEFWNGKVQPILDEWEEKFDEIWEAHIQPMLNKFMELLGDVADFLKAVWENVLKPVIDWIIENILPVLLPIFDGIITGVMVVAGGIADAVGGIIDVISGILQFLTGVFTGDWKKAWEGIAKIFEGVAGTIKGIINGILGFVESLANGVVNAINTVIRALNQLSFDIPDWIPVIGGNKFGFNIPELSQVSIPRLATGAVIPPNREFLAVLGDQKSGTNIEAPLDTLRQANEELLINMLSKLGLTGNMMGNNPQTIIVKLIADGKELTDLVIKNGKVRQMSTGKNIFALE